MGRIQRPANTEVASGKSARDGWAAVLTAATLWGTTGIVFHALGTSGGANAVSISFLRLALSVPFLLVMARIRMGIWLAPLTVRGFFLLVWLGLAMASYQLTYVLAIDRVGVAISVLISICLAPIFVALISVVWLGERLQPRTLVALVTAIVGTVLLGGHAHRGQLEHRWLLDRRGNCRCMRGLPGVLRACSSRLERSLRAHARRRNRLRHRSTCVAPLRLGRGLATELFA